MAADSDPAVPRLHEETSGGVGDGEDRAYEQRTSGGSEGEHDCLLAHGRERGQHVGNKVGCGSAQGGRNFVCRRNRQQREHASGEDVAVVPLGGPRANSFAVQLVSCRRLACF